MILIKCLHSTLIVERDSAGAESDFVFVPPLLL